MSYDDQTGRMNWKDESAWVAVSVISGTVLSFMFSHFNKFQNTSNISLISICCIGFYVLSILIRIQNHRGKILTSKTAVDEKYLKYVFPLIGFGLGLALIFL